MNKPVDLLSAYARAANRRAHELKRLDSRQRKELRCALKSTCQPYFEKMRQTRERQADQREDDMARARMLITRQKRDLELKPPATTPSRIDRNRLEKLAAVEVETWNAAEMTVIRTELREVLSAAIESFLGQQPAFQSERESIDLARASWSELRAATDYEGHSGAKERDEDGRER